MSAFESESSGAFPSSNTTTFDLNSMLGSPDSEQTSSFPSVSEEPQVLSHVFAPPPDFSSLPSVPEEPQVLSQVFVPPDFSSLPSVSEEPQVLSQVFVPPEMEDVSSLLTGGDNQEFFDKYRLKFPIEAKLLLYPEQSFGILKKEPATLQLIFEASLNSDKENTVVSLDAPDFDDLKKQYMNTVSITLAQLVSIYRTCEHEDLLDDGGYWNLIKKMGKFIYLLILDIGNECLLDHEGNFVEGSDGSMRMLLSEVTDCFESFFKYKSAVPYHYLRDWYVGASQFLNNKYSKITTIELDGKTKYMFSRDFIILKLDYPPTPKVKSSDIAGLVELGSGIKNIPPPGFVERTDQSVDVKKYVLDILDDIDIADGTYFSTSGKALDYLSGRYVKYVISDNTQIYSDFLFIFTFLQNAIPQHISQEIESSDPNVVFMDPRPGRTFVSKHEVMLKSKSDTQSSSTLTTGIMPWGVMTPSTSTPSFAPPSSPSFAPPSSPSFAPPSSPSFAPPSSPSTPSIAQIATPSSAADIFTSSPSSPSFAPPSSPSFAPPSSPSFAPPSSPSSLTGKPTFQDFVSLRANLKPEYDVLKLNHLDKEQKFYSTLEKMANMSRSMDKTEQLNPDMQKTLDDLIRLVPNYKGVITKEFAEKDTALKTLNNHNANAWFKSNIFDKYQTFMSMIDSMSATLVELKKHQKSPSTLGAPSTPSGSIFPTSSAPSTPGGSLFPSVGAPSTPQMGGSLFPSTVPQLTTPPMSAPSFSVSAVPSDINFKVQTILAVPELVQYKDKLYQNGAPNSRIINNMYELTQQMKIEQQILVINPNVRDFVDQNGIFVMNVQQMQDLYMKVLIEKAKQLGLGKPPANVTVDDISKAVLGKMAESSAQPAPSTPVPSSSLFPGAVPQQGSSLFPTPGPSQSMFPGTQPPPSMFPGTQPPPSMFPGTQPPPSMFPGTQPQQGPDPRLIQKYNELMSSVKLPNGSIDQSKILNMSVWLKSKKPALIPALEQLWQTNDGGKITDGVIKMVAEFQIFG